MIIWDNTGATPSKSGTHMIEQESKYTSTKKVNRDSETATLSLSFTQSGKVANFAF